METWSLLFRNTNILLYENVNPFDMKGVYMWFVMQLGMVYCYCVKFALMYILSLPFRLVAYLYYGIRYVQPLSVWWLKICIGEQITRLFCTAYATGQTAEEMKALYDKVIKIVERP